MSPSRWLPAERSTAGSSCSSTSPRCSPVQPARTPLPERALLSEPARRSRGDDARRKSLHENDTALTFAEWIASRPEATGADDFAEQVQVRAAVRGVWCSPVTSDHVLDVCSAFASKASERG